MSKISAIPMEYLPHLEKSEYYVKEILKKNKVHNRLM